MSKLNFLLLFYWTFSKHFPNPEQFYICFHYHTSIHDDFYWIFSYPSKTSYPAPTFSAVQVRIIHNEWQAISSVKFGIQLGVKAKSSVYKTQKRCALEQAPCCAVWRGETRWGKGGNYHIKGKEFKINLISHSPSAPLKRFTVSMLCLVKRHKERTESVKWRWEARGRGSDRGNLLASNQVEL